MNRLAIVGTHPGTRAEAPFDDLSYDIWVFNEAPQQEHWCKRWTAVFQLHKRAVYESTNNFVNKGHWDWLQQDHGTTKTIWMQEADERVPNSCRYPMDEIRMSIGAARFGQFTSTVTMAIALGLYLGYETIELWGVDLSSNTEYAYQQPGFLFWSGVAAGIIGDGYKLHCGLQHFSNRLYGYEGETQIAPEFYAARVAELEAATNGGAWKLEKLRERINDAITDYKPEEYSKMVVEAQELALAHGENSGALQEARAYLNRADIADPISRQQFERRGATGQQEGDKLRTVMDKESGRVEYVFNAWRVTRAPAATQQLRMFTKNLIDLAYNYGGNLGVFNESARYMQEYDTRVQAAGGERTLIALGVENGSN